MNDVKLENAGLEDPDAGGRAGKKPRGILKASLIVLVVILIEIVVAYVVVTQVVLPKQGLAGDEAGAAESQAARDPDLQRAGAIYEVKDVIVNPAGTHGTRYLSATIGLETYDDELIDELEKRDALVRDALINILSSKRLEELDGQAAKDSLRNEIIARLNPQLGRGRISKVYFTNYVIQ